MALPSTGQLSFNDIKNELLNVGGLDFVLASPSLGNMEVNSIVLLNAMSASRPDGAGSNSVSEWFGYNHTQSVACKTAVSSAPFSIGRMGIFTMASLTGTLRFDITPTFSGNPATFKVLYPLTGTWARSASTLVTTNQSTSGYYQFNYNPAYGNSVGIGILTEDTSQDLGGSSVFQITVACPYQYPAVSTLDPTNVGETGATGNGEVITQGASPVTSRGIVLGQAALTGPTISNNVANFVRGSGTGPFSLDMTGLSPNNQYYARAYATNSTSTSYGASIPFSYYKFRTICSLNWVTENLNRTWYNNGDPIQLITDPTQWATTTSGAYCYVNGSSSNTGAHGLLYNRYALEDPRGIIPRGYRIIDYYDAKGCFTILTGEGGAVKQTGTTYWLSPNTGATNISGFSALGSGYRNSNGTYAAFRQ
jgi:hypothetical protein